MLHSDMAHRTQDTGTHRRGDHVSPCLCVPVTERLMGKLVACYSVGDTNIMSSAQCQATKTSVKWKMTEDIEELLV